ncbi:MAG: gamma-glutamyltransferase family protein [Betaproteobacteria bacterium]|nr:gamma-glutamyltransferase family protein [Betaproteobacteria bacterium]
MVSSRTTIMGTRHVISAGHYLAAHAGFQILEAGGNAVDAGVAAGIAIGVLQTDKVNFGGVALQIIYTAKNRKVHCIDGLGVWPKAVTPDYFMQRHGGKIPVGVERCVVPAAPDAWITALERFGTMSFDEVASAATRFARDGFPMYPLMAEFIRANRASYERWPSNRKVYLPKGGPPQAGEIFVQAELGRTLQHMADEERRAARRKGRKAGLRAARDAFYKGDIARETVKFIQKCGGLMRYEDFAGFSVRFEPTVRTRFDGIEVHACGPWSQGPVMPIALNVLKGYDLKALGHNSADYIHVVTEALKLAFADRHHHFGDPRFVDVPIAALMSESYAAWRRSLLSIEKAWPEMPPAGDPRSLAQLAPRCVPAPRPDDAPGPGDTSYVCVIDRHGNAFSATPSDGSNTTPVIPGVGIHCSGRGTQSWADPAHPSSVAPGKRPRLTPNPAMAFRGGKVYMPFGTPGGDVQPQAMLQVFLNINVFGMDPQTAIEAPRFATYSYPSSFEPHNYFPGRLYLESRIAKTVGDELAGRGHKIHWWDDWTWLAGAVCTIVADRRHGVLHGGADPRRPAYVLGW